MVWCRLVTRWELNVDDNQLHGKGGKKCFLIEMKTSVMTMAWMSRQPHSFVMVKGHLFRLSMNKCKGILQPWILSGVCREQMFRISEELIYIKTEEGSSVHESRGHHVFLVLQPSAPSFLRGSEVGTKFLSVNCSVLVPLCSSSPSHAAHFCSASSHVRNRWLHTLWHVGKDTDLTGLTT